MGIKEMNIGLQGEITAVKWLAANRNALGLPTDCEIYHIRTEEALDNAVAYFVSPALQRNYGIDIVVGKFIDHNDSSNSTNTDFLSSLTIDVKTVASIYLELYGYGHFHAATRKFSIDGFQFRHPTPDEFTGLHPSMKPRMSNSHAQAYLFVSKNEQKVLGFAKAEDIINALDQGFIKGERTVPSFNQDKVLPNSSTVQEGNRQDMRFNSREFFKGIDDYIASKQESNPQIGVADFRIEEHNGTKDIIATKMHQPQKTILVGIPFGKERYLEIFDSAGIQVSSTKIV